MTKFYDVLVGLTMIMVGFVFLGISIISYAIIPCIPALLEIVGSFAMIVVAFYVLFKTMR